LFISSYRTKHSPAGPVRVRTPCPKTEQRSGSVDAFQAIRGGTLLDAPVQWANGHVTLSPGIGATRTVFQCPAERIRNEPRLRGEHSAHRSDEVPRSPEPRARGRRAL